MIIYFILLTLLSVIIATAIAFYFFTRWKENILAEPEIEIIYSDKMNDANSWPKISNILKQLEETKKYIYSQKSVIKRELNETGLLYSSIAYKDRDNDSQIVMKRFFALLHSLNMDMIIYPYSQRKCIETALKSPKFFDIYLTKLDNHKKEEIKIYEDQIKQLKEQICICKKQQEFSYYQTEQFKKNESKLIENHEDEIKRLKDYHEKEIKNAYELCAYYRNIINCYERDFVKKSSTNNTENRSRNISHSKDNKDSALSLSQIIRLNNPNPTNYNIKDDYVWGAQE